MDSSNVALDATPRALITFSLFVVTSSPMAAALMCGRSCGDYITSLACFYSPASLFVVRPPHVAMSALQTRLVEPVLVIYPVFTGVLHQRGVAHKAELVFV